MSDKMNYDFDGWTNECLDLNREVLEHTISEAHTRENVIYTRSGSLLALNGVILALICTFLVRYDFQDNWTIAFMTAGISILIMSSTILAYVLIPQTRTIIDPESGRLDYCEFKQSPKKLKKQIMHERIEVCMRAHRIIRSIALNLGYAVLLSTVGLWAIGSALIRAMIGGEEAIFVSIIILMPVVVFVCFGIKRIFQRLKPLE